MSKKSFVGGAAILAVAGLISKFIGVFYRIPLNNIMVSRYGDLSRGVSCLCFVVNCINSGDTYCYFKTGIVLDVQRDSMRQHTGFLRFQLYC